MSDGQERSEKATPQRLKEARRKGRLGRSQDLTAWVGLGAAAVTLPFVLARGRDAGLDQVAALRDVAAAPSPEVALGALGDGLRSVTSTLAPLLVVAVVAALVAGAAQGGVHPRSLKPQFQHLRPKSVMQRFVGPQAWWQAAKTLLKTAVVGLVLYVVVAGLVPLLLTAGRLPLRDLLAAAGEGTTRLLQWGIGAGLVLAAVDVAVVARRNRKQTRMTLKEVKDEHKRTEGDPLVKQAVRQRQVQMSRNRMMTEVAGADVVVVNPVHVAVALRYEPGTGAPRVVAKGAGEVARRIREEAERHRVPLVEDVPLARALHGACELGAEIPLELFTAVARVLAFVMALRRRGAATGHHRLPDGTTLPDGDPTTGPRHRRRSRRPPAPPPAPPSSPVHPSPPSSPAPESTP